MRGTTTKYVPGWNLDNIDHGSIKNQTHKNCRSGNSWYGWNGGTSIKFGSISTRLSGCGMGKLDFGECWGASVNSSVIVNLNGIEIGRAMSLQDSKTIVFNFKEGDIMELKEGTSGHDSSLIRFNSFTVISCC